MGSWKKGGFHRPVRLTPKSKTILGVFSPDRI